MYEKIMILCGIFGIIAGIPMFIRSKRTTENSESVSAEIIELRKSINGIIPVVKYKKNDREYKAVHLRYPQKSFNDSKYKVGDNVVINVVSGEKNEFYFCDEGYIYSYNGLQFIIGGGICLIIGIILSIALA